MLLNLSPTQNRIPSNPFITKCPTVVGDFTGHQVELLQTSALLGDDFHAPTTGERKKSRSWVIDVHLKAALPKSPEHARGRLPFHTRVRGCNCLHIQPFSYYTLMIKHLIWLQERVLCPAGEHQCARGFVWERVHIYTCITLACSL